MKHPFIIDSTGKIRHVVVVRYSFNHACDECGALIPATHETEYDELSGGCDRGVRSSVTRSDALPVVQESVTVWMCTKCRPSWHDRIMREDDE